jgi:hypothetical protein
MALRLTLTSPGLITRGLGTSPLAETTTLMRVLTLMMRVTTRLKNASCVMGKTAKEPLMKMMANTPCPTLRTLHA